MERSSGIVIKLLDNTNKNARYIYPCSFWVGQLTAILLSSRVLYPIFVISVMGFDAMFGFLSSTFTLDEGSVGPVSIPSSVRHILLYIHHSTFFGRQALFLGFMRWLAD